MSLQPKAKRVKIAVKPKAKRVSAAKKSTSSTKAKQEAAEKVGSLRFHVLQMPKTMT